MTISINEATNNSGNIIKQPINTVNNALSNFIHIFLKQLEHLEHLKRFSPPWLEWAKSFGTPGRNRTYDLRIRNPLLYPTELQGLV
ncbi:hypothetical protein CCP1ISM_1170006 [Azospirillaceae bacterium]